MVHLDGPSWLYPRHNLTGAPPGILRAEAERLAWNRRIIAGDLEKDPASWHGGRNNLDVIDALFSDALAMMLHHPPIGGAAW